VFTRYSGKAKYEPKEERRGRGCGETGIVPYKERLPETGRIRKREKGRLNCTSRKMSAISLAWLSTVSRRNCRCIERAHTLGRLRKRKLAGHHQEGNCTVEEGKRTVLGERGGMNRGAVREEGDQILGARKRFSGTHGTGEIACGDLRGDIVLDTEGRIVTECEAPILYK